jgi:antitoxin YefM
MKTIPASEARTFLDDLITETITYHTPIIIQSPKGNAILLAQDDWNATLETIHLLSIPRMHESIRKGIKEPIENCSEGLSW